jgi:MFS family permease
METDIDSSPINEQPLYANHINKRKMRLAVSTFYFCQGLCFASWASRIADIKHSLNLSTAALGTILFALPIGQLMTLPFSGRLVTKYGSKAILSFAVLLYALELTNLGWASAAWQLALALFVFGICGNLCNIAVNTQAVNAEKIYARPIMSSFHGAWSIAGFTGGLIGILMTNLRLTAHEHFMIVAGIVIVTALSVRKFLIAGKSGTNEKKKLFSRPDPLLTQLGMIAFCCMMTEGSMFEWSGVYFKDVVKVPEKLVIVGYTSFMIMMATGRFLGDKIIMKLGRKRTLQLNGLLIFSGLMVSVLLPHLVTATIGFLIVGFGVSCVVPTVYSAAGRHPTIAPGNALAKVSSIGFLGFLMGPPMMGYIAQLVSLRLSYAVIAVIGLLITVMVSKLKVMN